MMFEGPDDFNETEEFFYVKAGLFTHAFPKRLVRKIVFSTLRYHESENAPAIPPPEEVTLNFFDESEPTVKVTAQDGTVLEFPDQKTQQWVQDLIGRIEEAETALLSAPAGPIPHSMVRDWFAYIWWGERKCSVCGKRGTLCTCVGFGP